MQQLWAINQWTCLDTFKTWKEGSGWPGITSLHEMFSLLLFVILESKKKAKKLSLAWLLLIIKHQLTSKHSLPFLFVCELSLVFYPLHPLLSNRKTFLSFWMSFPFQFSQLHITSLKVKRRRRREDWFFASHLERLNDTNFYPSHPSLSSSSCSWFFNFFFPSHKKKEDEMKSMNKVKIEREEWVLGMLYKCSIHTYNIYIRRYV